MAYLAGALILLDMSSLCIDVILRYFSSWHIRDLLAYIEFSLIFITFLSAAWVLKQEGHVRVDFLVSKMGPRSQTVLAIFSSIIGIIVCLVFVWYGAVATYELWVTNAYDVFKITGFPKAIPVAIIPVGSFILLIQFVRRAYHDLASLF